MAEASLCSSSSVNPSSYPSSHRPSSSILSSSPGSRISAPSAASSAKSAPAASPSRQPPLVDFDPSRRWTFVATNRVCFLISNIRLTLTHTHYWLLSKFSRFLYVSLISLNPYIFWQAELCSYRRDSSRNVGCWCSGGYIRSSFTSVSCSHQNIYQVGIVESQSLICVKISIELVSVAIMYIIV